LRSFIFLAIISFRKKSSELFSLAVFISVVNASRESLSLLTVLKQWMHAAGEDGGGEGLKALSRYYEDLGLANSFHSAAPLAHLTS